MEQATDPVARPPRSLRAALAVAAAGVIASAVGAAWDVAMHSREPDLAAHEGPLTLTNPSHALAALGLVLTIVGVGTAIWLDIGQSAHRRGRVALAVGTGAVFLVVGATAGAASLGGDDHPHEASAAADPADHHDEQAMVADTAPHPHRRDYTALLEAATPEERAGATQLFDATRASIERFRDFDVALAEGYIQRNDAGATHYPSPRFTRDGEVLDAAHPETLVYWTAPDGTKVLMGALYKAPGMTEAPAPGGELTMWHSHPAEGQTCYPAVDTGCAGGQMLHVWVFDGVVDPFTESMAAAAGGRPELVQALALGRRSANSASRERAR